MGKLIFFKKKINVCVVGFDLFISLSFGGDENGGKRAPMTIFYNGMVSVFDVSPRKVCVYFLSLLQHIYV